MVVRIIESKEDKVITADLIAELKKSNKVDYSGAIFTFEGIVRGKEENMNLKKLILTTPDKEKTQSEIEKIVENAKIKYNVFYHGNSPFLSLYCTISSRKNQRISQKNKKKETPQTFRYKSIDKCKKT